MSVIDTKKGNDGRGDYMHNLLRRATWAEEKDEYEEPKFTSPYSTPVVGETEVFYGIPMPTGEAEIEVVPIDKIISDTINEAIKLIEEVIEIYDSEIDCLVTFSLFEQKVKLLWEKREKTNENFKDVLVHLITAAKNSHYQKYDKNQYKSFKLVLEKIKKVNISKEQVRECLKLFKANNIDLFAPLRNWKNYIIEIKENG